MVLHLKKRTRSKRYPSETITDSDYADYQVFLANIAAQTKSMRHNAATVATVIVHYMNSNKT